MSLNQLRLPYTVIADLYRNALVGSDPPEMHIPATEKALSPPLQYIGQNQSNIAILVNYSPKVAIPKEHLNFLDKVLRACQMTLADAAIVNLAAAQSDLKAIKEAISPKRIMLFGNNSHFAQIGPECINFSVYTVEGVRLMCIPDINLLMQANEEGKQLKTKLWANLKQFLTFNQ